MTELEAVERLKHIAVDLMNLGNNAGSNSRITKDIIKAQVHIVDIIEKYKARS